MSQFNSCGTFISSGLGDCAGRMQPIIGILIEERGISYTEAELATIAKTKTVLSLASGIKGIYLPLESAKVTTDEPSVETSPTGVKGVFQNTTPSMKVFLKGAFADFQNIGMLNNTLVDISLITNDKKRFMTKLSNGNFKGFRAQIYAAQGFPDGTKGAETYPIDIFFQDNGEFEQMTDYQMSYSGSEIRDLVPAGLEVVLVSPYVNSTKKCSVKVMQRGSKAAYSGLDTVVILDSAGIAVPTAVLGVGAAGVYELTLTDSAAAITSSDYMVLQLNKTVSTYATFITQPIRIYGADA